MTIAPGAVPLAAKELAGRHVRVALVGLVVLAAFALRLAGIGEPPLAFHPVRQLHSAQLARAFFVETGAADLSVAERSAARAASPGVIEPPLMEALATAGYVALGSEQLWFPRLISVLAWFGGAAALWALVRRLAGTAEAYTAALIYLFLPYGVEASRSFQPDPLALGLTTTTVLLLVRHAEQWTDRRSWWGAAAVASLAVTIKPTSIFAIAGVALSLSLVGQDRLSRLRPTVTLLSVALLPTLAYLTWGVLVDDFLAGQGEGRILPELLQRRDFWEGWARTSSRVFPLSVAALAVAVSVAITKGKLRAVVVGSALGYIVYGLTFTWHYATHDYYHLPLIPIAAIGSAVAGTAAVRRLVASGLGRPLALLAGLAVVLIAASSLAEDEGGVGERRPQPVSPARLAALGQAVGHSTAVISVSSDYGKALSYYGFTAGWAWPTAADLQLSRLSGAEIPAPSERFDGLRSSGAEYVVVTDLAQWRAEDDLRALVETKYTLVEEGPDHLVYDLGPSR